MGSTDFTPEAKRAYRLGIWRIEASRFLQRLTDRQLFAYTGYYNWDYDVKKGMNLKHRQIRFLLGHMCSTVFTVEDQRPSLLGIPSSESRWVWHISVAVLDRKGEPTDTKLVGKRLTESIKSYCLNMLKGVGTPNVDEWDTTDKAFHCHRALTKEEIHLLAFKEEP